MVMLLASLESISDKAAMVKRMIVEDYAAIGVLERFEDSLNVFAAILPDYFSGATELYLKTGNK